LPIPVRSTPTPTRYRDLNGPYGELVADLTKGRLTGQDWCHLDPDVNAAVLPRQAGWRGTVSCGTGRAWSTASHPEARSHAANIGRFRDASWRAQALHSTVLKIGGAATWSPYPLSLKPSHVTGESLPRFPLIYVLISF
jgi:hypothetical protein